MDVVYKYPLRISPSTASVLHQWSCACRYLWNRSLRLKRGLYERYKLFMGYYGTKLPDGTEKSGTNKRLTVLRNRYDWLRDVPNCAQQEILRNLDKAFSAFFRRIKRGETPGYPRFKHRSNLPRLYFPKERFSIVVDNENCHYLKLSKIPHIIHIANRPYLEQSSDKIMSCSLRLRIRDDDKMDTIKTLVDTGTIYKTRRQDEYQLKKKIYKT